MSEKAGTSHRWQRLLSPFSNVHPGEGARAALLLLTIFLIMTSFYVMKTAREGLILTGDTFGLRGDELKTYTTGAMAILLIAIVPAYDALADRHRRIRFINLTYAMLLTSLAAFFLLGEAGFDVGFAYFLWFGLASCFMVAQFWSYANDLYNEEQGKRLFALIATGGTLGAIAGPNIAKLANTFTLMVVAAGLLVGATILFNVIERRSPRERRQKDPIDGLPGGFALIMGDKRLLMIACLLFLTNVVNSTGEFLLSHYVREYAIALVPDNSHPELTGAVRDAIIGAQRREIIKAYYSDFFMWVNALSFVIQAFLVSRIIDKLGLRRALFILPLIACGAYTAIGVIGGLAVVRAAKTVENATDYSLQNTVWQTLFLKTERAVKYKAKATMDSFFVRAGDAVSAIVVAVGIHQLHLSPSQLAFVNVGMVMVWLVVAALIAYSHRLPRERYERQPMRHPTGMIFHSPSMSMRLRALKAAAADAASASSSNKILRGGVSTSSS